MKKKPSSQPECQLVGVRSIALFDLYLVQGALDSMGVALADHHHQWSEGEREIYDQATEIIRASVGDCMATDSLGSKKHSSLMPLIESLLPSGLVSGQLLALGYSPWRVALVHGHLAVSTAFRCCVCFCSCFVVGELRERLISLSNVRRQVSLAGGAGGSQETGAKALGLLLCQQALCLSGGLSNRCSSKLRTASD